MAASGQVIEQALGLAAAGIPVFPCLRNKGPAIPEGRGGHGFRDAATDPAEVRRLFGWPGADLIGCPTGELSGFDVLDVDYRHGGSEWETANAHRLPATRIHQTQSGGRHYLFRHAPGVRNSAGRIAPGIDVRGAGGYIVVPPSAGYSIIDDSEIADWPDWLLQPGLALPKPEPERAPPAPRQPISSRRMEALVQVSLRAVRGAADGQKHFTLRNHALRLGGLLHLGGFSRGDAIEWLIEALPASVASREAARKTAEWGVDHGADTPLELTDSPDWQPRHLNGASPPSPPDPDDSAYWQSVENDPHAAGQRETSAAPRAEVNYTATGFRAADLALIQPIDWVYPGLLPCGYFGALGAVPGAGKSALVALIAVSVAVGRDLLTGLEIQQRNVWVINLEDPRDHIMRLIWAVCEYYQIEPVTLEGRLFVDSGRDQPLIMAQLVGGAPLVMPVAGALLAQIQERQIGLLTIDPAVDTHALNENDNVHVNLVCALWNKIAAEGQCGILLSHHFRKGGMGAEMDSFRGASAFIGKSRAAVTLSAMTEEEAIRLGVAPERRRWHVRMDNARQSLLPPADKATWLRLESVDLACGATQALRAWEAPSIWEGLGWEQVNAILDQIERGPSPGEYYASAKQSKERWAGLPLVAAGRTEGQAVGIIKDWLESGVLEPGEYSSPGKRTKIGCVRVNAAKAAEMRRPIMDQQADD